MGRQGDWTVTEHLENQAEEFQFRAEERKSYCYDPELENITKIMVSLGSDISGHLQ